MKLSKIEKNKFPEIYGYGDPHDIPGNENEITVYNLCITDADGDIRFVPVSKELFFWDRNYKAYYRKKHDWESRCRVPSVRYKGVKTCTDDCSRCPYGYDHRQNSVISLDRLYDEYELEISDPSPGPEEAFYENYKSERIQNALMELDERSRQIIYLYYYKDKTDAEIAAITNSKRSTVRDCRVRSLKALRVKLSDLFDE